MDSGKQHAARIDAHHLARRQVRDSHERLAHQVFGFIVGMNARKNGALDIGAVVEFERQKLLRLLHGFARLHLHHAEIALAEGFEIDGFLKQRLNGNLRVIDSRNLRADERACRGGILRLFGGLRAALRASLGLHVREQQHVANARGVSEQHHHAVDTDANAARRRHAVFQGAHVVFVIFHGLIVAAGLFSHLGGKALGLVNRVVKLGERVGVFVAGDNELEAMREARIVFIALGERRNLNGVIAHERGVHDGVFAELVVDFSNELARSPLGFHFQALAARGFGQHVDRRVDGNLEAQNLRNDIGHGTACPLARQIDLLALVLNDLGVAHRGIGGLDNALSERLHAVEVAVGAVRLHGGELGVVRKVHALVAENAADLEHALEATNQAALQMELGGNAQVAFLVKRIEMRNERLSRSAALNGLQNRRFNFHIAVRLHVTAERGKDGGALAEGVAHVFVHDEVDIALAVTGLFIGEAVELLGQRTHSLRKQRKGARSDGELAALRAHDNAFDVHDVAQVKVAQKLPIGLGHVVDAAEKLNVGRGVAHHEEHDFALAALGHNTAADFHDVLGVFARRKVGVLRNDVAHVVGHFRVLGVRVHAASDIVFALGKTQRTLVVEQLGGNGVFGIGHLKTSSFPDVVMNKSILSQVKRQVRKVADYTSLSHQIKRGRGQSPAPFDGELE